MLTLGLVFAGVAIFGYIGALIVEAITRGVVTGAIAERRRRRRIDQLRDHYIICGYGRVGRQVGNELSDSGVPVVVLDFAAFLDAASATGGPDLRFEEIIVDEASGRTGQSIKQIDVRNKTGALIIALRKRDGTFDTTPNPDAVIDDGDVIICVGTPAELVLLEELFAPQQAVAR